MSNSGVCQGWSMASCDTSPQEDFVDNVLCIQNYSDELCCIGRQSQCTVRFCVQHC